MCWMTDYNISNSVVQYKKLLSCNDDSVNEIIFTFQSVYMFCGLVWS